MFSKVCILALLFAIAYSQSINTIEGTWTDSRYGGKLYFCTDDSFGVWGTFSEAGVYWGYLDESRNIAEGRWYQAGNSPCNSGYWEAFFNSTTGNELSFITSCDFGRQNFNYTETRINSFANDDQCNVVYDQSNIQSIEGTWGNVQQDFDHIDFCVFDDDDEGHASYSKVGINATVGYMTGQVMEHERLFQGDFSARNFEGNFRSGGVLFFPRTTTEAVMFMWPGEKITRNGEHDVITQIQYRDSNGARCEDNRDIVTPGYKPDSPASRNIISLLSFIFVLLSLVF